MPGMLRGTVAEDGAGIGWRSRVAHKETMWLCIQEPRLYVIFISSDPHIVRTHSRKSESGAKGILIQVFMLSLGVPAYTRLIS